jgi:hypothetical protein
LLTGVWNSKHELFTMNFKMMQNKIMFNQHEVINGMMNVLGLLPAYSAGFHEWRINRNLSSCNWGINTIRDIIYDKNDNFYNLVR